VKKLVWLLVLFQYSACATMFHGSTDQISVTSKEEGSTILLNGQEVGEDSAVLAVPKSGQHVIEVRKEGCTSAMSPIRKSFDGISLLGLLLDFGIFSMLVVDGAGTGAINRADQTAFILTPNCKSVAGRKKSGGRSPAKKKSSAPEEESTVSVEQ
jgi:hypothetical protein